MLITLLIFLASVFGGSLRGECWSYQQNKAVCLEHPTQCQWCALGGEYGTFCAPLGAKNCLAATPNQTATPNQIAAIKPWYRSPEEKEEAVRRGSGRDL